MKDQLLFPVLCDGWKDGCGVKWRLNAFNPIRQNPLSTDADEDNIFPTSPSPWKAQQKLCRVSHWAALLLPSKLIRFCLTKLYAQGTRTEGVPWWFNIPFPSQPHCAEYCGLHLTKQLHCSHARWDWWYWPSSSDWFWLHWPWGQRFSQCCLLFCSQIICSSKLLLNYSTYFTAHMFFFFFGQ